MLEWDNLLISSQLDFGFGHLHFQRQGPLGRPEWHEDGQNADYDDAAGDGDDDFTSSYDRGSLKHAKRCFFI